MGKKKIVIPKIGEIYNVIFEGDDSEQTGLRPALIIQNNVGNLYSPNVIVVPLTSRCKKQNQPTHVFVSSADTGLKYDSMVLCENPRSISKEKLLNYITTLPDKYMAQVAYASLIASSIVSFIDKDKLEDVWNRANTLNTIVS